MRFQGAAQGPSHEYRIVRSHPVGHREARRIAEAHGVRFEDRITILRAKDTTPLSGTNAHASYLSRRFDPDSRLSWDELFPGGRVTISVHRCVFLSDESIVAHLTHELFEVRELKNAFVEAGGSMSALDLHELIREGKKGNLHDRAWDEANRAVEAMRKEGGVLPR
jgi:hypothetical protein